MRLSALAFAIIGAGATLLIAANGMAQGPRSSGDGKPYKWHFKEVRYGLEGVKKAARQLPKFYESTIVHTAHREIADKANDVISKNGYGKYNDYRSYLDYGPWEIMTTSPDHLEHAVIVTGPHAKKTSAWPEGSAFYDNGGEAVEATYSGSWKGYWYKDRGRNNPRAVGSVNGEIELDAHLGAGEDSYISGHASGSGTATVYRGRGKTEKDSIVQQSHIAGVNIAFEKTSINPDGTWAQKGVVKLHPEMKDAKWRGSWGGRFSGAHVDEHNHNHHKTGNVVKEPGETSFFDLFPRQAATLSPAGKAPEVPEEEVPEENVPEMAAGVFGAWIEKTNGTEIGVLGAFMAPHDHDDDHDGHDH